MNILISRKELTDTFFSSKPLPMISVKVRTVHRFQQINIIVNVTRIICAICIEETNLMISLPRPVLN